MKGKLFFLSMAALLLAAVPAMGQQPAAAAKASLSDYAWLAGHWRGKTMGPNQFTAEESWADAKGGAMMGMFRLLDPANNNRILILEFFTLRETPEGLEMRVRHFDTALVPMEKEEAIILKVASAAGATTSFENPVHGRPKRTILTRTGVDSFTSRSEIIRDSGETSLIQVALERVGAGSPVHFPGERGIYKDLMVNATLEEVWNTFATPAGLAT